VQCDWTYPFYTAGRGKWCVHVLLDPKIPQGHITDKFGPLGSSQYSRHTQTQNGNPKTIARTTHSPYKLSQTPSTHTLSTQTLARTPRRIVHNKPNPTHSFSLRRRTTLPLRLHRATSVPAEDQKTNCRRCLVANGDPRKPRRRRRPCHEPNQQANPRLPQEDQPHPSHGRVPLPGKNLEQGTGRVSPHQTLHSRPYRRV